MAEYIPDKLNRIDKMKAYMPYIIMVMGVLFALATP
jgi:hypothetical protein